MNDLDRHLVGDVVTACRNWSAAAYAKQAIKEKLLEHKQYINRYGEDAGDHQLAMGPGSEKTKRRSSTEGDNV